ncbi:multidrug efflux MFS transporter [Legionella israelensis]|uniref:MFS transporter n=1 Tax=Legionella israelensis TaxID=454 RepID=UPI00117E0C5E|nr:MFS transporter [Legionella israelensis]QDP71211.1 multidrug efflux MFS transporter [Legionella israelensis]
MTKKIQTILLCSQFFILLALEMGNPFLPLLVHEQQNTGTLSPSIYSSILLALPMLMTILMAPIWGLLADRFGYKSMLMRAAWALVISQACMAMAKSLFSILLIRLLQGGFAGFIAAMQTYALSLSNWENKGRQLARLQTSKALATSVAGACGGFLLTFFGFKGLFLTASLFCLIPTLIMHWTLPESKSTMSAEKASQLSPPSIGLLFPSLALLIILTQTARFLPDSFFSIYASVFTEQPWLIGLLYSLPATGILLSAEYCGRQFDKARGQSGKIKTYFVTYSGIGMLLMLAHACMQNFALLCLIRLCWGIVIAALLPALFTLVSDLSPKQGYAIGLANSLAKMGNLTGLLLGGWFAGFIPLPFIFFLLAMVYALISVACFITQFTQMKINKHSSTKFLGAKQ